MTSRPSAGMPIMALLPIVMVLLAAFYVLGIGPLAWLAAHGHVSTVFVTKLYWPLELLTQYSPFVHSMLHGYVALFVEAL